MPLQTLLLASYLVAFSLPLVVMAMGGALSHELLTEREDELVKTTSLVTHLFDAALCRGAVPCPIDWTGPAVEALLGDVQTATKAGVRVVDMHGVVIATSGPRLGADLSDREEVQAALRGEIGTAGRTQLVPVVGTSRLDLRKEIPVSWAVATAPLTLGGERVGALLLTRPTREVSGAMANMARPQGTVSAIGSPSSSIRG